MLPIFAFIFIAATAVSKSAEAQKTSETATPVQTITAVQYPPSAARATAAPVAPPASARQNAAKPQTRAPSQAAHAVKKRAASQPPAAARTPVPAPYAQRPEVQAWAREAAQALALPADWVAQALARARYSASVAKAILPAPTPQAKNWQAYRARFVEPTRIADGVQFWQANHRALERAQAQYGVAPEYIVAILGVETLYGQSMGRFRVLDALATLAFDFPAAHPKAAERQAYFRGELQAFLRLCHDAGTEPDQPLGSYAGALGMPQFMPSNWSRLAVDFDADGRVDLLNSAEDAIGSVAHYFQKHGWQTGRPTHFEAQVSASAPRLDALLAPDIVPTFSAAELLQGGVALPEAAQRYPGKLALVQLQNGGQAPTYVAGTDNFYAITRYNQSSYYALAVSELAQAIRAAYAQAQEAAPPGR